MSTTSDFDQEQLVAAFQTVARFAGRPLHRIPVDELKALRNANSDIMLAVLSAQRHIRECPRGRARLRLVAVDGDLTQAGTRCVRARKAARTRALNRNSQRGIS